MKKIIVIGLLLLVIIGGIYFWRKNKNKKEKDLLIAKAKEDALKKVGVPVIAPNNLIVNPVYTLSNI